MQCSNVEILMQCEDLDKYFTWVCFECMKLLHSVPSHNLNFDLYGLFFTDLCKFVEGPLELTQLF